MKQSYRQQALKSCKKMFEGIDALKYFNLTLSRDDLKEKTLSFIKNKIN